jgi:hypothetical protein
MKLVFTPFNPFSNLAALHTFWYSHTCEGAYLGVRNRKATPNPQEYDLPPGSAHLGAQRLGAGRSGGFKIMA